MWQNGTVLFLSLCCQNDLLVALLLVQLPCWQLFELLPFLVHCGFRVRNFHCPEHRNKLVHQIVVTSRIEPLLRDAIFTTSWQSRFHTLSHGFLSFHDACMLSLLKFIWLWSRLRCPEAYLSASLFTFCKALPPPWVPPTFSLGFFFFFEKLVSLYSPSSGSMK